MKHNKLFVVITTIVYSYLFYAQYAGINFLLFNLLLIALVFFRNKELLARPAWLLAAAGALLSAFFVFWWGTCLIVVANICSLLVLAGLSFKPQASILVAAFNTAMSAIVSIPKFFSGSVTTLKTGEGQSTNFTKILVLVVPLAVTSIFVLVYRSANPIFEKFTDQVNFDFISFDWCVFTAIGFFMMYGFFNQYMWSKINEADSTSANKLATITLEEHLLSTIGKRIAVSNEVLSGIILFVMLNILLLCVNGLDVFYMWILNKLPQGVSVAAYLHDGADTLIFSILMAIAVILFIFRGYLNFFERNKILKGLAYTWIVQNIILVITTANRNWWIIESSGLTRRRIGVYVYLLLCIIGLTTTFIKVKSRKSNWYLFRINGWAFYGVLVIACFIDWDSLIVNYNCKNFKDLELGYIDRGYQAELSHTALAALFKYYADEKQETNPGRKIFTPAVVGFMFESYNDLKNQDKNAGWQSLCISKRRNLKDASFIIEHNLNAHK